MITKEKSKYPEEMFNNEILPFICTDLREKLSKINNKINSTEEIRLRSGKPLMIQTSSGDWFIDIEGQIVEKTHNPYIVKQSDIIKTLELMSENSVYAYQDDIRNGFITLRGGHRVGITGRAVCEGNSIKNLKNISGLNIRVSRTIHGCSDKVIDFIIEKSTNVYSTLIISPPQCGKTTILRDIARAISDGIPERNFKGIKVGIIDERSEIAACYKGTPQYNVGIRTDILDGCPKAEGMTMMLRSMSPQVIITDEIGNQGDKNAVMNLVNAGVKLITSAHGYNISELKSRKEVLDMIENGIFERFVVLSNFNGPGTLEEVIDGISMKVLYRRNEK